MDKRTIAINTPYERPDAYGALSVPIYNNVAFEFADAAEMADAFCNRINAPDYSRVENPTVTNLELRVRSLTNANSVAAFNSGMAAISNTLLATLKQGSEIVTSNHLFGNTLTLVSTTLARFGVKARLTDLTDLHEVEQTLNDKTACVFLEAVTNPQLEIADVEAISRLAHAKGIPVIIDSTAIPFTHNRLHELGVDIEVLSSTKYLSGGGTSLGGLVIDYGTFPEIMKRIKTELLFNFGAYMTPQTAYMQTLGLETLHVRYEHQSANALHIAKELRKVKGIKQVNYIGLPDNPFYSLATKQFGGDAYGAMLTIDLGSKQECFNTLNRLKLIHRATNLFDNRTLAIHPASTIFGMFSEEKLKEIDVKQTTIRLSIGLEDPTDIINDIKQALE